MYAIRSYYDQPGLLVLGRALGRNGRMQQGTTTHDAQVIFLCRRQGFEIELLAAVLAQHAHGIGTALLVV